MSTEPEAMDLSVVASLARHLAFSPVAFAMTEGPAHEIRYANAAFQTLQSAGDIWIGDHPPTGDRRITDLTPLLNRAFSQAETIRDEVLTPTGADAVAFWSCTVWPIPTGTKVPDGLVLEVRDAAYVEASTSRQRIVAERLLLAAMREQDKARREQETARAALDASRRAAFLAAASRDLSMSLDQDATRDTVARRALPRPGTWCIVDIVESNGALRRLAVVHPDPAKQKLARSLADHWEPRADDPIGTPSATRAGNREPTVITHDSGAALVAAAHGPENLATLEKIGFGPLLVVPLVVRGMVLGAITFVTPRNDPLFSPEEITLASELADRCAMALDNARLYRESDVLRASADVANRAKSAFLGNMSHELMTPLNAIGGYAELIDMGLRGPVTADQRTDLGRIRLNQQHLMSLISEMLTFVRFESGRMEYRYADIPVEAAINEVSEMLEGAAAQRGLTLERGDRDHGATAWADPDRLRQILMNLLMNAVKYSVDDGSITLSSTTTSDTVLIHVGDRGPGIAADMLEVIFDPFVQLEGGLTKRQGGVGLGLAISRDLARAMNGDLTVESTVGVGSTFTLGLPRAPQAPASA